MTERELILNFQLGDELSVLVKTSFENDDIQSLAEKIIDEDENMEMNNKELLHQLELKGYIKVIGSAPEVLEIW